MKNILILTIIVVLFLVGCTPKLSQEETAIAVKVVNDYYFALNAKDYRVMYSFISEGFKKIEPTANSYERFEQNMQKFFNIAKGIRVISTEVDSVKKNEVVVNYVAEINLIDGTIKELKSSFTVKKKPEGWRLTHPYGDNKDLS